LNYHSLFIQTVEALLDIMKHENNMYREGHVYGGWLMAVLCVDVVNGMHGHL
jgi:hypothetical protein